MGSETCFAVQHSGLQAHIHLSEILVFLPATPASGFFGSSERASDMCEAKIAGTAAKIEQKPSVRRHRFTIAVKIS